MRFVLLILLAGAGLSHRCTNAEFENYWQKTEKNLFMDPILPNQPKSKSSRTLFDVKADEKKPIRIYFDYYFLDGPDPSKCNYTGQIISWGSQDGAICEAGDIMTAAKKKLIVDTFENIRIYLSKLLKVVPAEVVTVNDQQLNYPMRKGNYTDRDLHITVYGRPYNSGGLASATSYYSEVGDYRPKVGFIMISPKEFTFVANYDSPQRRTFDVVLHEVFHAMGVSSKHFSRWIDPSTKIPFEKNTAAGKKKTPYYVCPEVWGRKNITFVTTPSIKKFIETRYGNTDFGPKCESGLELEDDGGTGSVYTHPETRAFPGDIMKMASDTDKAIISPLTLALLEATGYYEVNWDLLELYGFGDASTNYGQKIENFTIMSPRRWPKQYQCPYTSPSGQTLDVCYPDLRFKAGCPRRPYHCPSEVDIDICNNKEFFDPDNTGFVGDDPYRDYALSPLISRRCTEISDENHYDENYKGATPSNDAICFMSSLNKNSGLNKYFSLPTCYTIDCKQDDKGFFLLAHVGNYTAECRTEGQVVTLPDSIYKNGTMICPNPEWSCKMRDILYEVNYSKVFQETSEITTSSSTASSTTTSSSTASSSTASSTTGSSSSDSLSSETSSSTKDNGQDDSSGSGKGKSKTNAAAIAVPIVIVIAIIVALVLLFIFNETFKSKVTGLFKSKESSKSDAIYSLRFDV